MLLCGETWHIRYVSIPPQQTGVLTGVQIHALFAAWQIVLKFGISSNKK